MNLQIIIVLLIIGAAVLYAVSMVRKQARSFSKTKGCEADCGCSGTSKKVPTSV